MTAISSPDPAMMAPGRLTIVRVQATPLNIPITLTDLPGGPHHAALSLCLVEVELASGVCGIGFTAITEEEVIAAIVTEIAAPALLHRDAWATEAVWEHLYWLLSPRGQGGYAAHAIAALDIALWDAKARSLGVPLWRLLGGARSRVPAYATFGFMFLDREQLAETARRMVDRGFRQIKMVVGQSALRRRDEPRPIEAVLHEDLARVRAVREAIGPEVALCVDANCNLDPAAAAWLATRLEPFDIRFFEEPITQNDADALADLRRRTRIPLAGGQNEGLAGRFRLFLEKRSLDVLQPNVAITGGFTLCLKIAGMAQAYNMGIDNGGAWPHLNMHLHGGVMNGGMVEMHAVAVACCQAIFDDLPQAHDGWLTLPEAPGLGFRPAWDRIADIARRPASRGAGKAG